MMARVWEVLRNVLLLGILIYSVPGSQVIPFYHEWGLDFQNLFAFHNCASANSPYKVPGVSCGDWGQRDLFYPPLLYWSFYWTRFLTFKSALWVWGATIAVFVMWSLSVWSRLYQGRFRATDWWFAALLVVQYPVTFAIERGNSDVVILAMWSAAAFSWVRGSAIIAGFLWAGAAAYKVYPTIALLAVAAGLLVTGLSGVREEIKRFRYALFGGALLVGFLIGLLFDQYTLYVKEVLPVFAQSDSGPSHYSHSLSFLRESYGTWAEALARILVLLPWILAAFRCFRSDPAIILAGALASSVYIASTSYDYNLLVTFPLLVLLFQRRAGVVSDLLLAIGLCGIVGHRGMWGHLFHIFPEMTGAHIILQAGFIALSGLLVAFRGVVIPEREVSSAVT